MHRHELPKRGASRQSKELLTTQLKPAPRKKSEDAAVDESDPEYRFFALEREHVVSGQFLRDSRSDGGLLSDVYPAGFRLRQQNDPMQSKVRVHIRGVTLT